MPSENRAETTEIRQIIRQSPTAIFTSLSFLFLSDELFSSILPSFHLQAPNSKLRTHIRAMKDNRDAQHAGVKKERDNRDGKSPSKVCQKLIYNFQNT
jgi:hypothetical protein